MSRSEGHTSKDDINMEMVQDWEGREWQQQEPRRRTQTDAYMTTSRPRHVFRHPSRVGGVPMIPRIRTATLPQVQLRHPSRQNLLDELPSHGVGFVADTVSAREAIMSIPLLSLGVAIPGTEEDHADQIVSEMEKDEVLMEDNPASEQLRLETLRELPELLTMKRTIKKKLVKSVTLRSKHRPISMWKRMKYKMGMSFSKFNLTVKDLVYSFELWYNNMKKIEGHFGSGVATYFRFLRLLFLLNVAILFISFGFIVIPQLLYRFYEPLDNSTALNSSGLLEDGSLKLHTITPLPRTAMEVEDISFQPRPRNSPYASNVDFAFSNIFTGQGFFTNTTLFYGYYTNESVQLVLNATYDVPSAYFFTIIVCSIFMFLTLAMSMARSYRHTFIETSGGVKNVFAHKIFCSWDFSIATDEAAVLKSRSIYNELKELLQDVMRDVKHQGWETKLLVFIVRLSFNVLSIVILISIGILMWFLLNQELFTDESNVMIMPVIITAIMMLAPIIFSWFARMEDYNNPRTALFVTLIRTYALGAVVIGVVIAFWLTYKKKAECWETSLGQEVYRLIITDFLLVLIGTSLAEFMRSIIHRKFWKAIGAPEFDIARNTLNLIYNQTLFFVGFYFSPMLALIIIIKLFITFYVKKVGLFHNCQPFSRPWRAAQTHTMFLFLASLSMLSVIIFLGYVVTQIRISDCGPFRGEFPYPYEMILSRVFKLRQENDVWKTLKFLTKPGVMAGVLLAMGVAVYYLRAKSQAHIAMVNLLREMLVVEAKDKEFLLNNIAKVSGGHHFSRPTIVFSESGSTSGHSQDGVRRRDSGSTFSYRRGPSSNVSVPSTSSSEDILPYNDNTDGSRIRYKRSWKKQRRSISHKTAEEEGECPGKCFSVFYKLSEGINRQSGDSHLKPYERKVPSRSRE